MSWENSSTGRQQNEKTFNFVNKTTNDVRGSDKYMCNLTSKNDRNEIISSKKLSSNLYNKSTKGEKDKLLHDKMTKAITDFGSKCNTSNKHQIKCSDKSSKSKLKLKKNGFFDDVEALNSHRANPLKTDKIIDEGKLGEPWLSSADELFGNNLKPSNSNTDRGHYHNLLMHQDGLDNSYDKDKDTLLRKSKADLDFSKLKAKPLINDEKYNFLPDKMNADFSPKQRNEEAFKFSYIDSASEANKIKEGINRKFSHFYIIGKNNEESKSWKASKYTIGEKPNLEIQIDSMIDSTSGYKQDNDQEKEFTFKSSSIRTIDAESTSKSVGVISGQVRNSLISLMSINTLF